MRVLVCRPWEEAQGTARALADAGHEAVIAPVLAIVPLPVTLPRTGVDALVLTSRHAVESLADGDVERQRHRAVFAVGAATAAAARDRGFDDVRVAGGDASSLPDLVRLTLAPGARLAYLAGRIHKPALPEALRAAGYRLDLIESYEACATSAWPEPVVTRLRDGTLDACLHFSRRSAALALAFTEGAGLRTAFLHLRHGCLSQDVAEPLIEAGALDIVVAEEPSEARLLQAMEATLR